MVAAAKDNRAVAKESALVLNKSWQTIGSASVERAMKGVCNERARFVYPPAWPRTELHYSTYDFAGWAGLSVCEGEPFIQGAHRRILLPEVIVCSEYKGFRQRRVKFSRRNLWKRDRHCCQYCGTRLKSSEFTIDHVTPRALGGQSTWENCVIACLSCNKRKDNKTLKQACMSLFRWVKNSAGVLTKQHYSKPVEPQWSPIFATKQSKIKESWTAFIDHQISELYWETELEP